MAEQTESQLLAGWSDFRKNYVDKLRAGKADNDGRAIQDAKDWYRVNGPWVKEQHTCPCGGRFTVANLMAHRRTNKHQAFIGGPVRESVSISCPCGGRYTAASEMAHKWTKKHKAFIGFPVRESEAISCPCGGRYTSAYKSSHRRTARHLRWCEEVAAM